MHGIMIIAAATPTVAEKIRQIPLEFWWKAAVGVAILIGAIMVLRKLAKVSKPLMFIILMIVLTGIGFNWIYERNEPSWATPVVQVLAGFFPSKGGR